MNCIAKEEGVSYYYCTVILFHLQKYFLQILSLCYNCLFLSYCEVSYTVECRPTKCLYSFCQMKIRFKTRKDLSLVEMLDILKNCHKREKHNRSTSLRPVEQENHVLYCTIIILAARTFSQRNIWSQLKCKSCLPLVI